MSAVMASQALSRLITSIIAPHGQRTIRLKHRIVKRDIKIAVPILNSVWIFMEITNTIKPIDRAEWRTWLVQNHNRLTEIWLLSDDRPEQPTVEYLDAVEEALCFGWIDGIAKRFSGHELAQRFTPRKRRSHWTELNKARARRLIQLGLMTAAGSATLPDLDAEFIVPQDILAKLRAEPQLWAHYQAFPDLYQRVRISYIEEMRKNPPEFDRRLQNFLTKTAANKMFGNWQDGGRLV
jgi:uncharacterized protein YdeI (YjbR/CyaY-like superfamily)